MYKVGCVIPPGRPLLPQSVDQPEVMSTSHPSPCHPSETFPVSTLPPSRTRNRAPTRLIEPHVNMKNLTIVKTNIKTIVQMLSSFWTFPFFFGGMGAPWVISHRQWQVKSLFSVLVMFKLKHNWYIQYIHFIGPCVSKSLKGYASVVAIVQKHSWGRRHIFWGSKEGAVWQ